MKHDHYCFEGETRIKCTKCGLEHVLSFSGSNPASIDDAIEEAIQSENWGVASKTCPDCYDPLDEQRAEEEQIGRWLELEEEYDYGDYDDDWDYEEEDT